MINTTEAKCDGLVLTVAFPTANPPLIWRFDLERNHSFTLALHREEKGDWALGVTSPKGDFCPVASFVLREEAEDALAKVGKALAQKKPLACANGSSSLVARALTVVGIAAAFIILIVLLFALLVGHRPRPVSSAAPAASTVMQGAVMQDGVPLSADDVLKPPR